MSSLKVIDSNMSDKEKVSLLLPQVIELCKGDPLKINGMIIVVFDHRYKNRFDYFLRQMVRSKAREQIKIQPPKPSSISIVSAVTKMTKQGQLLLSL